jgi:hypothetical protein
MKRITQFSLRRRLPLLLLVAGFLALYLFLNIPSSNIGGTLQDSEHAPTFLERLGPQTAVVLKTLQQIATWMWHTLSVSAQ